MEFKDIQAVNKSIKTMDIKGKRYALVNERIKAFRKLFPEGSITTEIIRIDDLSVVIKATIIGNGIVLATGTAHESIGTSPINKTSYVENCETSAIGRALGMVGIGIDTSVSSAEEVDSAVKQQDEKATFNQVAIIKANLKEEKHQDCLNYYKIEKFEDLTKDQADKLIKQLGIKKKAVLVEEES